jgi:D-alanine-D-alanine ligase-like ATP-grasp enzyme
VRLRHNANLSTGGTATDVTDDVHPEVAERAIAAAQMVGLHVCGVDMVCESVLEPLEEQGGGIVEVNAAPGLRMHLSPVLRQAAQRRRGHRQPPVRTRATTAASRWSRSPAPTARRPPRA